MSGLEVIGLDEEEPVFIVQTFNREDLISSEASYHWFDRQWKMASTLGCTWPRYTINSDSTGLLFEAWIIKPSMEGAARWSFAAFQEGVAQ